MTRGTTWGRTAQGTAGHTEHGRGWGDRSRETARSRRARRADPPPSTAVSKLSPAPVLLLAFLESPDTFLHRGLTCCCCGAASPPRRATSGLSWTVSGTSSGSCRPCLGLFQAPPQAPQTHGVTGSGRSSHVLVATNYPTRAFVASAALRVVQSVLNWNDIKYIDG
ncbi:hypothetical protein NDU88_001863 [Pleurodeles waltl]|uniref:Uncharacterized protein n=1 Tax=Pleurodeles waltl TaxID=8319 RepID=A0AAV7UVA7_PLEWA|nr:hypothetical protein NDU88_001863 [Pleurodeles waltl]